jgi:hypothetical protein
MDSARFRRIFGHLKARLSTLGRNFAQLAGFYPHRPKPTNQTNPIMKRIISSFCISLIIAPFTLADDCGKGKCGKEKQEETLVLSAKCDCGEDCVAKKGEDCAKCECKPEKHAVITNDCGKCKKKKDCGEDDCKEGTVLAGGKCKEKDGDCDKDKEETVLAGKCKKKKDCGEEECEEGTVLAGKCKEKDGDCDKDKEETVLA